MGEAGCQTLRLSLVQRQCGKDPFQDKSYCMFFGKCRGATAVKSVPLPQFRLASPKNHKSQEESRSLIEKVTNLFRI